MPSILYIIVWSSYLLYAFFALIDLILLYHFALIYHFIGVSHNLATFCFLLKGGCYWSWLAISGSLVLLFMWGLVVCNLKEHSYKIWTATTCMQCLVKFHAVPGLVPRPSPKAHVRGGSGNETACSSLGLGLASFPGLQSPNAVEGLVKLLRRMTSNVYPTYVRLSRSPTSTWRHLRMSFTRPARGVRHERNLVHRRQKSKLKSRNPEIQAWNPEIPREIHFEIQKSILKSRNPLWNPEIHFEIRNPLWNPEIHSEIRNPLEIQWISKSRTPRRAVADPSG